MGMVHPVPWSREQVLAFPEDGNRYELIDGALLVTPAPRMQHQAMLGVLMVRLASHVDQHHLGRVLSSPADLFGRLGQLVQPDLFVIPTRAVSEQWEDAPEPILAVEILSPSTARYDRVTKRRFYQRAGVPEYWIVDADARVVERWRPGDERPEMLEGELRWQPRTDATALVIDLPRLFSDALDA
jgi:Uma2 family endonuclease